MNSHPDDQLPTELEDALGVVQRQAFSGAPVAPNGPVREFVSAESTMFDATRPAPVTEVFDVAQLAPAPPELAAPRRSIFAMAGAALGTTLGKVLLTGGIAAAAVAGAHSTGAVDIPLLPDVDDNTEVVAAVDDRDADDSAAPNQEPEAESAAASPIVAAQSDEEDEAEADTSTTNDALALTRSLRVDLGERVVDLTVTAEGTDISEARATCDAAIASIDSELSTPAWIAAAGKALETCDDSYGAALGDAWEDNHSFDLSITAEGFDFAFNTDELDDFGFGDFGTEDFDFEEFGDFDFEQFGDFDFEEFGDFDFEEFGDFDFEEFEEFRSELRDAQRDAEEALNDVLEALEDLDVDVPDIEFPDLNIEDSDS